MKAWLWEATGTGLLCCALSQRIQCICTKDKGRWFCQKLGRLALMVKVPGVGFNVLRMQKSRVTFSRVAQVCVSKTAFGDSPSNGPRALEVCSLEALAPSFCVCSENKAQFRGRFLLSKSGFRASALQSPR